MRLLPIVVIVSAACHSDSEPQICRDHCVVAAPPTSYADCCDSTTCYVDPDGMWHVVACDPPRDPCDRCTADEICIARYDGQCNGDVACVPRTIDCPGNACSPACEAAYCPAPYQCEVREPCGTESPLAFTCYGP